MALLFNPPQSYDVPVSLGGDLLVTFKNKTPGSNPAVYIDYPINTSMKMLIGKGDTVIEIDGVIDGSDAVFRLESEVADTIKSGVGWRLIFSIDNGENEPVDDIVIINGKVVRVDGS